MSSVVPFRTCRPHVSPASNRLDPSRAVEIVKSFNTWAFKREQPSDIDLLHETAASAVRRGAPLDFVLYWGKGPRSRIGAPDRACLDFLSKLAGRVGEVYAPGALFHIVMTDTHARLNGHSESEIAQYFGDITCAALGMSFGVRFLSDVVAGAGAIPTQSEPPAPETLASLEKCAAKWYRGDSPPDAAARKYFDLNMIEKRAIEQFYPASIFVTFNDSSYRVLFPDLLPIFYMYSIRRGVAVKPWFMPDPNDAAPGTRSATSLQPAVDAAE